MENFTFMDEQFEGGAKIKVFGAGGGGGNAVNHMIEQGIEGVDFAIVNTDIQALNMSPAPEKIQIGSKLTKGLGAGANPEVGRRAAEESIEEIRKSLEGYDLVFVAVGLGGGTGSGSAPVIAEAAREMGILTISVVTLPFGFEGRPRMKKALESKGELVNNSDTIITVPNSRLSAFLKTQGKKMVMKKAFEEVNNVLCYSVQGITDLITKPGIINLDFADIRTVMSIGGASIMGIGTGSGEERIRQATEAAINNPLLEHGIENAQGIILNIAGNDDLDFDDFEKANEIIYDYIGQNADDAEIIVGTVLDSNIPDDTVYVTVVATGFDIDDSQHQKPQVKNNRQAASSRQAQPSRLRSTSSSHTAAASSQPSREAESDVTKEMDNIFKTLDMPGFMQKHNL